MSHFSLSITTHYSKKIPSICFREALVDGTDHCLCPAAVEASSTGGRRHSFGKTKQTLAV